ncbi:MAG: hypothetical protein WC477_06690 [Patescibacteria group bacterium]
MDDIVSSTSQGSAILAYGRAGSSRNRLIVLISVVAAVLLVAMFFAMAMFESPTVPADRALVITLRPNTIASHISGDMLSDLPSPWRAALQTNTSFPIRIGFRKTLSGSLEPFASVPAFISVGSIPDTKQLKKGFFRIITTSDVTSVAHDSLFTSISSLFSSKKVDASWSLNLSLLDDIASNSIASKIQPDDVWVSGTWNGTEGSFIDADSSSQNSSASLSADLLGASLSSDQSDATTNSLLRRGIDLRNVSSTPSDIHIPSQNETIVSWDQIPENDRPAILAAFGSVGRSFQDLPDKTQADLILFPDASQTSSLENQTSFHSGTAPLSQPQLDSVSCTGNLLFILRGNILIQTLAYLHIPSSWADKMSGLAITREGKLVRACVAGK